MIGIIFIGDLKYCPYLNSYLEKIDLVGEKYEVLYWNREGLKNEYPDNFIAFEKKSRLNKSKYLKLIDFVCYKLWLNNHLVSNKYDRLILLSTLSGVINYEFLLTKFKGRYIFDIRDYSFEYIQLFAFLEKKIINESFYTSISSEGFRNFLPLNYPYLTVHNFRVKDVNPHAKFSKKEKNQSLSLVWMGAVRYFSHQKKIIDRLKNDIRFHLVFHGSGAELDIFINYCKENNVSNVLFSGAYDNNNKANLIINADILNNSYMSSKMMEVKYAISNKYYDGVINRIPQLVELNTFKADKVIDNGLGIALDPNDNDFADKLFDYYHCIDEIEFNQRCKVELSKILKENEEYSSEISKFITHIF